MDRTEKLARKLCSQHGEYVRKAQHGDIWKLPGGAIVSLPSTPSDPRGWLNTLADIKRALRGAGVEDGRDNGKGDSEEQEAIAVTEVKQELRPEDLGVYHESTAKVLREEHDRFTIPAEAVAKLFGAEGEATFVDENGVPMGSVVRLLVSRVVEDEEKPWGPARRR